jgi:hypothetical protein
VQTSFYLILTLFLKPFAVSHTCTILCNVTDTRLAGPRAASRKPQAQRARAGVDGDAPGVSHAAGHRPVRPARRRAVRRGHVAHANGRGELGRRAAELRQQREEQMARETRTVIARMHVEDVPTSAGRRAVTDACLVYRCSLLFELFNWNCISTLPLLFFIMCSANIVPLRLTFSACSDTVHHVVLPARLWARSEPFNLKSFGHPLRKQCRGRGAPNRAAPSLRAPEFLIYGSLNELESIADVFYFCYIMMVHGGTGELGV